MKSKAELRREIKQNRKSLDIENLSVKAVDIIREFTIYKTSDNVMLYYPMQYELNLLELTNDCKQFFYPKTNEFDILVCPAGNSFQKSKYNIYEPCTKPIDPNIIDLIIVPALAADENNYRLGYGGGFYDRFLAKYPNITTLSVIPKQFKYKTLPQETFDLPVKYVIFV